jgi:hypothetical protein
VLNGQNITFSLTVTNVGAGDCDPATVLEDLHVPGLTVNGAPAQATGWTCGLSAGDIKCDHPTPIHSGDSFVFDNKATVTAVAGDTITNCATVTNTADATFTANNKDCKPLNVVAPNCDLKVTKTMGHLVVGQPVEVTITVENVGTDACPGPTSFVDHQPSPGPGLVFSGVLQPDAPNSGWACILSSVTGDSTCSKADPLESGYKLTFRSSPIVAANAQHGSTITNCATIFPANTADVNSANDTSCPSGTVV